MSQERTEQRDEPRIIKATVENVGYVPHQLHFTEEDECSACQAARAEIERLNATIAGQAEAIREQTAKVQERDAENERMRREQGLTIAQQFKEIERLRAAMAWYADEANYDPEQLDFKGYIEIDQDYGGRARAALKGAE